MRRGDLEIRGFGNTFRRKEMESWRGRPEKRWIDRIENDKEMIKLWLVKD